MARNEELDGRVLEALAKTNEGCAFEIASALFPEKIEEPDEFRALMADVSKAFGRLGGKGLVEKTADFAGLEFFRSRTTPEELDNKAFLAEAPAAENKRTGENVEHTVLQSLESGGATASEITARLFPLSTNFRARTSQVYVCLKRLEKKELVVKEGKTYKLLKTAETEQEPILPEEQTTE